VNYVCMHALVLLPLKTILHSATIGNASDSTEEIREMGCNFL
jgi:hypothetical protein